MVMWMRLVRFVLRLVIAALMVSTVVVGLGTANTGPVEKLVLVDEACSYWPA
jgi:hypothetical protein